jgi:phage FluMu protein Com
MHRCDCGDIIHVQYVHGGYMESCATCDDFWIDASVSSRKCPKCNHSSDEVYEFTTKEGIKRIACRGCDEGFDLD